MLNLILNFKLQSHDNCLSQNGESPLHAAALSGSTEVVAVLLEAGADPTLRNGIGIKFVVI